MHDRASNAHKLHTEEMKEIVQNLYNLIAQTYDHAGAATVSAMEREMYVTFTSPSQFSLVSPL
jgi:hypothetical protein